MTRRSGTRGVPRAEREASILRAASDLFSTHGYGNVSLQSVAERADVSKALVISYFTSKPQLFRSCVTAVTEALRDPIETAVRTSEPGLPMALAAVGAIVTTLADHPRDWAMLKDATIVSDAALVAALAEITAPLTSLAREGAVALMASSDQAGDPLDVEALQYVWDAVLGACMGWWFEHPEESPDVLRARFARLGAALLEA